MTHLVVGAGQVGVAVHKVLSAAHQVTVRDLTPVNVHADVLHVCIPWSDRFTAAVKEHADVHGASLVVVHSTVPVGTCDPHGWVHSPVRGRHPRLAESLRAFVKHFGGPLAGEAAPAFEAAGCPTMCHPRAAETEAAKLWELTQFGVSVLVEKKIHAWCQEQGLDFGTVYTTFAETYNAGYRALGEDRFIRPVLEHMPGPIGGHCVRENATLLGHPLGAWINGDGDAP